LKYLLDNCISFRFAPMLRSLGVDIVALREEHPEGIEDIDLFRSFRGRELVFITADRRQTTRAQEARALRECGVTALFFGPFWSRMDLWPSAVWILSRWPRIAGFGDSVTLGTCAEIKQNGKAQVFVL
jgi:PIN like domain